MVTICAPWSVKDLTAHVIGDDLGVVSRGRDGFIGADSYGALVAAINEQNEQWVRAMGRLSPGVIIIEEAIRCAGPYVESGYLDAATADSYVFGILRRVSRERAKSQSK